MLNTNVVSYILTQKVLKSLKGVNSYNSLFAGMSNVWKRYLFANLVTYTIELTM